MELAYLFIKGRVKANAPGFENIENAPFKVFKDSEFCFSNDFEISYNDSTGLVSIVPNPELVPNFFDKDGKIKSVTSIVGMNGTGKSSVLEFIKSITDKNFTDFPYKFLAIFNVGNEINKVITNEFRVIHHDNLKYNSESDKNLPPNCSLSKPVLLSQISSSYEQRIPPLRIIYLSNILEVFSTRFSGHSNGDENLIDDISSTGLLNKDVVTKKNKDARFYFEDCYHAFRLMECKRQIDFVLNKDKFRFAKFRLPTFIAIEPDLFYETEVNETLQQANMGFISNLFTQVGRPLKSLKDKYCFNMHKSVYYYLVRYFTTEALPLQFDIYTLSNREFVNNNISNDRIKSIIQSIITSLTQVGLVDDSIDKYRNILYVLNYIDSLPESDFMYGLYSEPILILNFDENSELCRKYSNSLFITGYWNLEWRFTKYSLGDLSSGEKAMLSIFSRFHDLENKYIFYPQYNPENLVILIDEGDQLLHPEWQREFLFYLLDFLPKVFSKTNSIQLVITSHSPFVTSDLPRYCLLYLEKDGNGITKVIKGNKKPHTLGANIHQLYRDSFYMPNSMMGEFARRKIDELIKELQLIKSFDSSEQQQNYLKRAEMIGERFLSTKIKDLIHSKSERTNDSN